MTHPHVFTDDEQKWIKKLKSEEYDQLELYNTITNFDNIISAKSLLCQLETFDQSYPGGLLGYLTRARQLLSDSKEEVNPFDGYTPDVPMIERLLTGSTKFSEFELLGLSQLDKVAFVLVAGGLGERLGYPDIKVSLPVEITTGISFIEFYIKTIIACQNVVKESTGVQIYLPLAIMTSDDTHDKTFELLKKNNYFGLLEKQLTIMRQAKVPAVINNNAHLSIRLNKDGVYEIESKPHGHGDVHTLLNTHGIVQKWSNEGRQWLFLFQDTNALVFHALPVLLGVSAKHNLDMNSLVVPRKPGEAVGAVCKLQANNNSEQTLTINVEYNRLSALLNASGIGADSPDPITLNSRFPGNTNVLVFKLSRYAEILKSTGGNIPEFVNPKYKDASKTMFKSSTRLECLMQEFPRLFTCNDKVGVTELDRWACFTTVKNNTVDASAKSQCGLPPECAFSGEADVYYANCKFLELAAQANGAKVDIANPVPKTFLNVKYVIPPKVVILPNFAICLEQLKARIKKGSIKIAEGSTLILDGNVEIDGLELDGALLLRAEQGKKLSVKDLKIKNAGWKLSGISTDSNSALPLAIRGYEILKYDITEITSSI